MFSSLFLFNIFKTTIFYYIDAFWKVDTILQQNFIYLYHIGEVGKINK